MSKKIMLWIIQLFKYGLKKKGINIRLCFVMIELVLSIFLGEGWGWGEMQMYYSPCLTKHPSGSVNMPSVLVYFTFNDLGIKRSHYTFRPYPVDFFSTHLVSVSWLAFFVWVSGWRFYFSRSFSFKKVWSSAFLHSMHIYADC